MTENAWQDIVEKYASNVGFTSVQILYPPGAPNLPSHSVAWSSNYATILGIQVEKKCEAEQLLRAAAIGQEWLDVVSMQREREQRRVVDAYLILVIDYPPAELDAVVRSLELNPSTCRKHVVWPDLSAPEPEIMWRRLLRITPLGLPASPVSTGMINTPALTSDLQKRVLEDIKTQKGKEAARQHALPPVTRFNS